MVSGQLHVPAPLPPGERALDRRLGGPKSRSGRGGEEKNPQLYRELNPGRPARTLVTILTELPRLVTEKKCLTHSVRGLLVMTPCGVAVGYRRFGVPCCLHLDGEINGAYIYALLSQRHSLHPENGGSKVLRNVGILPHHHTVSQSRRHRNESSPL
jgi:hypothetical protein